MEAKPLYEAEAKKRQIRKPKSVVEKVPQQNTRKSRDKAATDFGTNGRYVTQAEKVKAQAIRVTK